MTPFKISAKARGDLKSIATYTQKRWGRAQRNIYLKQFDDIFHTLAGSPELGTHCDLIKPGYLKLPQGSHVIFYKHGSNCKIEIIRILHEKMDVDLNFVAP